jgi:ABC-type amino acid transport substrate-binding protein
VTEVLGYDPDFQPFTWQEEGAACGLAIEIVRAACGRAGIEVAFVPADLSRRTGQLARGAIGGLACLAVTPARLNEFEFSRPYLTTGAALFSRVGDVSRTLDDITGLTLATPATGPVLAFLQATLPGMVPVAVAGYREALAAVLEGTADVAALNAEAGLWAAERWFPGRFGPPGPRFMEAGLAVARPSAAGRGFLEDFDVGLEAIRTEGTIIHS